MNPRDDRFGYTCHAYLHLIVRHDRRLYGGAHDNVVSRIRQRKLSLGDPGCQRATLDTSCLIASCCSGLNEGGCVSPETHLYREEDHQHRGRDGNRCFHDRSLLINPSPHPQSEEDQLRLIVLALSITFATMIAPTAIASAANTAVRITFSTTLPSPPRLT